MKPPNCISAEGMKALSPSLAYLSVDIVESEDLLTLCNGINTSNFKGNFSNGNKSVD